MDSGFLELSVGFGPTCPYGLHQQDQTSRARRHHASGADALAHRSGSLSPPRPPCMVQLPPKPCAKWSCAPGPHHPLLMILHRALSPPTLHQRPQCYGMQRGTTKPTNGLHHALPNPRRVLLLLSLVSRSSHQCTSAFNPDAALCSAAPTPTSRCRLLLSPSSYFQLPALSTHSPSSHQQLLCQMGRQMCPRHTQHGPAGVPVLLGSLSTKPQHHCSYSSCRDGCSEPIGLGGTASAQIWLFLAFSCMLTALLAMSAHTGAGCADSSSTPGANCRAPPASGWHPVCIPTPETHRTAQTGCSTPQDSLTEQLPTASPRSRITATLTSRQLPAGRLLDGSASSLPLSPTHFPLLFSLGELRATQTICHPSEHPPGSDGFRETGSEVSG